MSGYARLYQWIIYAASMNMKVTELLRKHTKLQVALQYLLYGTICMNCETLRIMQK